MEHQLGPVLQVVLGVDTSQMRSYGWQRDADSVGDLFVAEAIEEVSDYLPLTRRQ